MHRILALLILTCCFIAVSAQELMQCESVAYDGRSQTWFISNPGNATIVSIGNYGDTSLFAGNLRIPLGLVMHKNLLWCADSSRVIGYSMDGSVHTEIEVPNARQLNGIIAAPDGGLLVSDRIGNAILWIKLPSLTYDTLTYGSIRIPNGLALLDSENLIVVNSTDSASLFILNLHSGAIVREIKANRAYLDGITRFRNNYFIASSWGTAWKDPALLLFDLSTMDSPRVIFHGQGSCADIHYFGELGVLAVPMYYENRLRLITVEDVFKASFPQ